jgi:AcrR family transcriptional regulator
MVQRIATKLLPPMSTEQIDLRQRIIDTALTLYMENRGAFTLRNIAAGAGCETADIHQFFNSKQAILRAYYNSVPLRFQEIALQIPEFDTFTLGEKISNYVYTSFDILTEHRDFVEESFERMILGGGHHGWSSDSAALFRSFVETDSRIPEANRMLMRDFVYTIMVREYFQLIRYWLTDDSEGSERTIALVDKLTAFGTELAYSGILSKGFDLAKYVVGQDIWKSRLPENPFAGFDFSKFSMPGFDINNFDLSRFNFGRFDFSKCDGFGKAGCGNKTGSEGKTSAGTTSGDSQ